MVDASEDIVARVLASGNRRRRRVTYREFLKTLRYPGGKLKGHPCDPDSDRCQAYLIDEMDRGHWERIYVCAPPQIGGKTIIGILLPALRNAIALGLPVGYGLPTLQDLDKAFQAKIRPAIKNSGYGDHLPTSGPGARGGRGPTIQFTDPDTGELEGMLIFLAGGAYGDTVAAVALDEVDQFRGSDGTPQWGAIEDIFSRANAFGSRAIRIAVGTVEDDTQSIILPLVLEQGTGTRLYQKCPHCGEHQIVNFENFRYEPDDEESAAATAVIVCAHCAATWSDADRLKAIRSGLFAHRGQSVNQGQVVGPAPRTKAFGLLFTAFDSTLTTLADIAVSHFRAAQQLSSRNDHGLMRKFWRYQLCSPYTADQLNEDGTPNQLTRGYLVARSTGSDYGPITATKIKDGDGTHQSEECPSAVESLVIACDVQRGGQRAPGRLYYLLSGVCSDQRSYDLAWGSLNLAPIGAQPNTAELHAGLDRLHALAGGLGELYGRSLVRRGIDVGDRQDEIRQWLIRYPEWWPVKGIGHTPKASDRFDIPEWIYRREMLGRWWLYEIDVNKVRRQAQMSFLVPVGKPGAAHVPRGLIATDSLVRHYCGTAEITDGRGGTKWSQRDADRKYHPEWARRIDLLDCRTYNAAMARQWMSEITRTREAEEYTKALESQAPRQNDNSGWISDFTGDQPWNASNE